MACRAPVPATSVAAANEVSATVPCSSSPRSWSSMINISNRRRRRSLNHSGVLRLSGRRRPGSSKLCLIVRASLPEKEEPADTWKQLEESFTLLKVKWESVENKTNLAIYGGGGLVFLWLSSSIVGAINTVPLLPKVMELIGLGYTGWFAYRYLLFKSNRKELVSEIEELKSKITGSTDDITD
ncbi:unnamed protein product [Sphagnum troendelagicum]|uniref:Cyanobacterial aminoacyl-tRNA synthetase CAAD domain-containing protein n=1 Tax=Sphagnum troendelagicum TaxID=128251 RepID=A0ABP0UEI0_9BRYO